MATSENKLHPRWAACGLVLALPLGCVVEIDDPPPIEHPELSASLSRCIRGIAGFEGRQGVRACVYVDQLPCTLEGTVTSACPSTGGCQLERFSSSDGACTGESGLVFEDPERLQPRVPATLALVHVDETCPARAASCDGGSSIPGRTEGQCFAKAEFAFELDEEGRLSPAGDPADLETGAYFEGELSLEDLDLTAACDGVDLLRANDPVPSRMVAIRQEGRGAGRVTSRDPAVQCPEKERGETESCTASLPQGGTLVLEVTVDELSQFSADGWSGCDSVSDARCSVTTSTSVTASFELQRRTLTVEVDGGGVAGPRVVALDEAGMPIVDGNGVRIIDCFDGAGTCTGRFPAGDTVVLETTDQGGVILTGWGGECQGVGTATRCTLTMVRDRLVSVAYEPATTVELSWTGPGTVSPNVPGLDCSASPCTFARPTGSTLQLDASPDGNGAGIIRWVVDLAGADCDGEECTFELEGQRVAVEAVFGWEMEILYSGMVPTPGLFNGALVSQPSGIALDLNTLQGSTRALFEDNDEVTLTFTPGPNTNLAEWGGACRDFGDALQCRVTMDGGKIVRIRVCDCEPVTVIFDGSGEVVSDTASVLGPMSCQREACTDADRCKLWFDRGAVVTFQATPSSSGLSWSFDAPEADGWSGGGCSGNGTCTVTVAGPTEITAGFYYPVSFETDIVASIFERGSGLGCEFCHSPNPPPIPDGDMFRPWIEASATGLFFDNMTHTATAVRDFIVNEPAQGDCAMDLMEPKRINETEVADSLIVRYPLPEQINPCPNHGLQNAFTGTSDPRYLALLNWIAGGCPTN